MATNWLGIDFSGCKLLELKLFLMFSTSRDYFSSTPRNESTLNKKKPLNQRENLLCRRNQQTNSRNNPTIPESLEFTAESGATSISIASSCSKHFETLADMRDAANLLKSISRQQILIGCGISFERRHSSLPYFAFFLFAKFRCWTWNSGKRMTRMCPK